MRTQGRSTCAASRGGRRRRVGAGRLGRRAEIERPRPRPAPDCIFADGPGFALVAHGGFGLGEVGSAWRADGATEPLDGPTIPFSGVSQMWRNISGASGSRLLAVLERGGRRRPRLRERPRGRVRVARGPTRMRMHVSRPRRAPVVTVLLLRHLRCRHVHRLRDAGVWRPQCTPRGSTALHRALARPHAPDSNRTAGERAIRPRYRPARAWQQRVQAQLRGATAEERLVRAVASYTPDLHRLSTHRSEDETSWAAVCLALDTGSIPIWESKDMYDWFRSRAASPPSTRVQAERRRIIGPRCVNRDAWVFTSSTVRRLKESGWAHDSIGLLSDGTLLLLRGDSADHGLTCRNRPRRSDPMASSRWRPCSISLRSSPCPAQLTRSQCRDGVELRRPLQRPLPGRMR